MKMSLGTILGLSALLGGLPAVQAAAQVESRFVALEQDADGKELLAIWSAGEDAGFGKLGPYPFDEKGKAALLASLQKVPDLLGRLVVKKLLSEAEEGLLKLDWQELTRAVQEKRPKELELATCYEPMMATPARESFERLSARLPFLEKLSRGQLSPFTMAKTLAGVRDDLDLLRQRNPDATFDKVDEPKARELDTRITAILQTLGDQAASGPTDWQSVEAAYAHNLALARQPSSTTAERNTAEQQQKEAVQKTAALVQAGFLTGPEGELIKLEFEHVREDIFRDPPSDSPVECYKRMLISPTGRSLQRVKARLPHLEKLVLQGSLKPGVAEQIIQSLEGDLAVLQTSTTATSTTTAYPQEREAAEKILPDLKEKLNRLKGMIAR